MEETMGPKLQDVDPALLTTFGAAAMLALKDAGWLARELTTDERAALQQQHSAGRQGQMKSRFSRGRRIA
jgi:hypothetical protein